MSSSIPKIICVDPVHGTGDKQRGVYYPDTCAAGQTEAAIVIAWANCLREILMLEGVTVARTRVDAKDPAPVSRRNDAKAYGCRRMISLYCNATTVSVLDTKKRNLSTRHSR